MSPEIRSISYNNARFSEGSVVEFTVLKKVELSENEAYYVLLDPKGYKILLPAEAYSHYGFKQATRIKCRVDKVNCSGQVFIEPLHPYYEEGKIYMFEIKGHKAITEEGKVIHYILELSDALGMSCNVKIEPTSPEEYLKAGKIRCLVSRIKKARLYLRPESELNSSLLPGTYYPFLIKELKDEFYTMIDSEGNFYRLEAQWYKNYNLRKGKKINCRFVHYAEDGTLNFEPENPIYKEGQTYEFAVRYFQKIEYADATFDLTAIADDIFGEEAHIKIPAELTPLLSKKNTLTARVDRIRKSRVHATAII
ncbi:MAG: hypothetical protein K0B15_14870 [Lentimicrobium sp.]|nr:hypothetical protein [Lentimicrobium sp.]